jgi:hypothetical protein
MPRGWIDPELLLVTTFRNGPTMNRRLQNEKCQRPCEEWFLDIRYPYLVVTTMWFIHKLWLDTHRSPQTVHKIA